MSSLSNNANRVEAREQCPRCKERGKDTAKDNLAIYGDGHKWCYSCQYYVPPDAVRLIEQAVKNQITDQPIGPTKLPSDATKTIPAEALQWLDKYGITREEIIENDIRWSPTRHALVFPIRSGDGTLKAWQRRNFSPNDRSKWISYGDYEDHLHIINSKKHADKPIVIVEDIISAIKVGRYARALCLFGSHVNAAHILRVQYLTKKLIFWLDADKYTASLQFAKRAEQVGLETRVVYTPKDPKECDDLTILQILDH